MAADGAALPLANHCVDVCSLELATEFQVAEQTVTSRDSVATCHQSNDVTGSSAAQTTETII